MGNSASKTFGELASPNHLGAITGNVPSVIEALIPLEGQVL